MIWNYDKHSIEMFFQSNFEMDFTGTLNNETKKEIAIMFVKKNWITDCFSIRKNKITYKITVIIAKQSFEKVQRVFSAKSFTANDFIRDFNRVE